MVEYFKDILFLNILHSLFGEREIKNIISLIEGKKVTTKEAKEIECFFGKLYNSVGNWFIVIEEFSKEYNLDVDMILKKTTLLKNLVVEKKIEEKKSILNFFE